MLIPPHDTNAEIAVLGSFLLDPQSPFKVADSIISEDFYYQKHRIVFDAILDLFSKHNPIDIVSVSNRLKEKKQLEDIGGMSALTSFINAVPTAANIVHYASIVRKKRILRDMIEASHQINQLGYNDSGEVDELLDEDFHTRAPSRGAPRDQPISGRWRSIRRPDAQQRREPVSLCPMGDDGGGRAGKEGQEPRFRCRVVRPKKKHGDKNAVACCSGCSACRSRFCCQSGRRAD